MFATTRHRGRYLLALASVLFAAAATAADRPAPSLETNDALSREGYYQLSWSWEGGGEPTFVLQEAHDADFTRPVPIYRGRDTATFLSGQRDGRYHYRVRAVFDSGERSPWSQPVTVTVDHYPLAQAFAFFGIGAVVFAATLALVIGGSVRMRGVDT